MLGIEIYLWLKIGGVFSFNTASGCSWLRAASLVVPLVTYTWEIKLWCMRSDMSILPLYVRAGCIQFCDATLLSLMARHCNLQGRTENDNELHRISSERQIDVREIVLK